MIKQFHQQIYETFQKFCWILTDFGSIERSFSILNWIQPIFGGDCAFSPFLWNILNHFDSYFQTFGNRRFIFLFQPDLNIQSSFMSKVFLKRVKSSFFTHCDSQIYPIIFFKVPLQSQFPQTPYFDLYFNFRWHSWSILWLVAAVWIRRFSTWVQLPLFGRLRRSWETIFRDHLLVAGVQNQVSRKLFLTPRQPRMC